MPPMTDITPQGLAARGMRPDAAEILAKEMQAIVAADRWKARDLHSAPPEKWHKLRPETQQFWIDTATRILAALGATPAALADYPAVRALMEAAEARGMEQIASELHQMSMMVPDYESSKILENRASALRTIAAPTRAAAIRQGETT